MLKRCEAVIGILEDNNYCNQSIIDQYKIGIPNKLPNNIKKK